MGDCTCLDVFGEDPDCVLHGIGTDHWAQEDERVAEYIARVKAEERERCAKIVDGFGSGDAVTIAARLRKKHLTIS